MINNIKYFLLILEHAFKYYNTIIFWLLKYRYKNVKEKLNYYLMILVIRNTFII